MDACRVDIEVVDQLLPKVIVSHYECRACSIPAAKKHGLQSMRKHRLMWADVVHGLHENWCRSFQPRDSRPIGDWIERLKVNKVVATLAHQTFTARTSSTPGARPCCPRFALTQGVGGCEPA